MSENLTFPVRRGHLVIWLLGLCAVLAASVWIASASLDEHFYDRPADGSYAWFGDAMAGVPLPARVGFWLCLALLCALGVIIVLRRWRSGLAPLILSSEAVTGFGAGAGNRRVTIRWPDVTSIEIIKGNLVIKGVAATDDDSGMLARPVQLVVNASIIGQKPAALLATVDDFRARFAGHG